MILNELIIEFQNKTGRLDLTDIQIIALLNRASMFLDALDLSSRSTTGMSLSATMGEATLALPNELRYIETVNIILNSSELRELTKEDAQTLRNLIVNVGDFNTPLAYAKVYTDIEVSGSRLLSYLLLYPIPAADCIIEVIGDYYSPLFSDTNIENKWSVLNPELLIQATQYLLIKEQLNIDESSKILLDLKESTKSIAYDSYVEEDINQMGG